MLKLLYRYRKILVYAPLIIHWVSIFILTSLPSNSVPHFALNDKIKHFTAYFVLSIFLALTLKFQSKFKKIQKEFVKFAVIISVTYSTFDELHQIFIPGRDAEILDWLANLLGLMLGLFIVKRFLNKSESFELK